MALGLEADQVEFLKFLAKPVNIGALDGSGRSELGGGLGTVFQKGKVDLGLVGG